MKVDLFVQDKELGIEFEMKFDSMNALVNQVYNLTGIIDRAKSDKLQEEKRLAKLAKVKTPLGVRPSKPAASESYENHCG